MRVPNIIAVGFMLLLIMLLQGCGRKGPLYLQQMPQVPVPEAPAKVISAPVQPAQSAVPESSTIQNPIEPVKQP